MLRWLASGVLIVCSIVLALGLVLQWGILPRIERWRPQLEVRASQALGVPVRIGALATRSGPGASWLGSTALVLSDVRLLDPSNGDVALSLPRLDVSLSPTSLLPGWDGRWRLRFEQVFIEGAQLDVRRDRQGRIHVAGLVLGSDAAAAGDDRAADWFFSQSEFVIRRGTLLWTDELREAPPLALREVDLVVRNGVRRHALRLDATPPAEWGERFSLRGRFSQPPLAQSLGAAREASGDAAPLLGRPGDWRRWRGTLYAELPSVDMEPLRRQMNLPFDLSRGRGALRAWLEVRDAKVRSGTVDVALRDLALRLAPQQTALDFERLDGRLQGRLDTEGGELRAERFGFATADGLVWPQGDGFVAWRLAADGAAAGGELAASRLDLGVLREALARVPANWVAPQFQEQVATWAPAGVASQLAVRWDGPPAAPSRYRVAGTVRGLALASAAASAPASAADEPPLRESAASSPRRPPPGRPGVQGLDVELSATEAGGRARLALRDGTLDFPGVFEPSVIPLQTLQADLDWRIDRGRDGVATNVELRTRGLRFANADTAGEFDATWRTGEARADGRGRLPGVLDLTGRLSRAEAVQVARYLPLGVGAGARRYVERAVLDGRASAVNFRVRGDLRDFPFPATKSGAARGPPENEFRVVAQLAGVRLAYVPDAPADASVPAASKPSGWPAFHDVSGELVFERESMELRDVRGRLATVGSGAFQVSGVRGSIRRFDDSATLAIEGTGRGPLDDALRFVQRAPVGRWLGGALDAATATGGAQAPAELQLALTIPLHDSEKSRVRGALRLAGNDLRLRPEVPLLAGARAQVAFTERGFTLTGGAARALGGDLTLDGALQDDGSLRFNVQGTASAEALARSAELGPLARAASRLSGQTGYRLALGFVHGRPEWQLSSNLVGLGIDLPAPLRKAAASALPLRVQASLLPPREGLTGNAAVTRDQLRFELGAEGSRLLEAHFLRELAPQGPRVVRGGIGVLAAAPQPADGVAASLDLALLDIDAWRKVADEWERGDAGRVAPTAGADTATGVPVSSSSSGSAASAASAYLPNAIALRAREVQVAQRRLHQVVAGVSRGQGAEAGLWRVNAQANELDGYGELRADGASGAGRVVARLARLSVPKSEAEAVGNLFQQAAPARLPALDILVEDFELGGKRLGRVEVLAQDRAGSGGWQLDRLKLATPDAQLNATGEWAPAASADARRKAVLDFRLDIADGGALLSRLGEAGVVRGAKGRMSGRVGWLGSPLEIDYGSLSGQMKVAIERGQFLQAEPGVAKLLGVLSLQSLPRRLLLDFRDVFQKGFAFDSVAGDVDLAQGIASTGNLRMRGLQALVLVEGRADMARETQDLRMWVVPEVNAGAASLAVAAINPAVGLGTFVAQWLLRRPLIEAGTREFHVTGPWVEPKVERVQRSLGDAMPSAELPNDPLPDPPAPPPAVPAAPSPSSGSAATGAGPFRKESP